MKIKIGILIFFLMSQSFIGCKSVSTSKDADNVSIKFYYGEVITTSPDGKTTFGKIKFSKVKRIVNYRSKTIREIVSSDGKTYDTYLRQTEIPNKFSVTVKGNLFSGYVIFTDEKYNNWTYDIYMTDGSGEITGNAFTDSEGIKTEKYFTDMKGNKMVKIVEKIKEITQEEYQKLAD